MKISFDIHLASGDIPLGRVAGNPNRGCVQVETFRSRLAGNATYKQPDFSVRESWNRELRVAVWTMSLPL
jgi:hypothetical protein